MRHTDPHPRNANADSRKQKKKREHNRFHDWLEDQEKPIRGEKALWIAVITQAMMDALSRSRNDEARYYRDRAIRWLSDGGKDFTFVCLCAGFDPDHTRRKAKRALAAPIAWRAAPGKGKRYLERKAYRQRRKESQQPPPSPAVSSFFYLRPQPIDSCEQQP